MESYCTADRLADRSEAERPSGDRSFEVLFRQHQDRLQSFLLRRLRSREDAEDALMQTFYQAWRARERFRGETSVKQWLYGIAGRVSIDFLRGRRRVERLTGEMEPEASEECSIASPDPMELLLRSERQAEVREAVERLTPEQRRLVRLYYFDGWRQEEIGSILGVPHSRVRGRLLRIRRRMERDLIDRLS